jgi:hypothetical protein
LKAEITIFFPSFTTLKRVFFKTYAPYKPIIIYILGYWGRDCSFRSLGKMRSRLGMWWDAIAFGDVVEVRSLFWGVGVRSLFGMWECDRFWGVGSAIAFGDVGSAIAFWGCVGCDRCFGMWGCDRCFGNVGSAIAVWDV